MKLTIAALALSLAGCMGMPDHKIADGQAGCTTLTSLYGSVSSVVTRADNTPKGMSASGKTRITCGSAVMEIESNVSAPPPPPADPATGRSGTPPALP